MDEKIKNTALFCLSEWNRFVDYDPDNCWNYVNERQLCRDFLQSLKFNGLIQDFNLKEIVIDGVSYPHVKK